MTDDNGKLYPFRLIPEWEQPRAIAIVWPGGMQKYDNAPFTPITDDYLGLIQAIASGPGPAPVVCYPPGSDPPAIIRDMQGHNPPQIAELRGVNDIWIRDFAPLPAVDRDGNVVLIKAGYKPRYLTRHEADPQDDAGRFLSDIFKRPLVDIPLMWDIGNFTHNGEGSAIVTRRIVEDNEKLTLSGVRKLFKIILGIDNLMFIDEEPGDPTGHLDAAVRFIAPGKIAIARYPSFMKAENRYIKAVREEIENRSQTRFNFVDVPCGVYYDIAYDSIPGIFGNHMNFLRTGRRLFVPAYNVPSDAPACEVLRKHLPGCEVVPVPVATLAHFGGSINCMTWGVY